MRVLLLLLLAGPILAHGGAYRGPADSAPPPDGGGASGGQGGSAPTPATGSTATTPGAKRDPRPPAVPRPTVPGPSVAGPDETVWQRWWGFDQHAYLELKAALHTSDLEPDSIEFFLGHAPAHHARDRMRPSAEQIRSEVVPALLHALEAERDGDVVTGALIALAKIGDRPGEDALARVIADYLADDNQEIAETAAVSLGILAGTGAAPTLEGLLRDSALGRARVRRPRGVPLRTRAFAAYGLGLVAHANRHPALRAWTVRALVETFEAARELPGPDVEVACLVAVGLVPLRVGGDPLGRPWSSREAQLRWLSERLQDADLRELTRAHVPSVGARLLVGLPEPARAAQLGAWCDALEQRDTPRLVRQGLMLALGHAATSGASAVDARARNALVHASRGGGDLDLRHFAIVGIGRVAARPGVGAAPLAGRARLRGRLLEALVGGANLDRPWAAMALGVVGRGELDVGGEPDRAVGEALRAALTEARAPREVGALAIALGMRRDAAAVPLLLARLEEVADDDTRGYLCLALGMTGAPEALEPVRTVVRASRYRPALLRQAAIAMGLLGDKNLVPEMCATLERAGSLAAQASIASGLGAIGDARSIEPLIRMLDDREITPRARAFAAVALGIVADKEPRPWNAKIAIGSHYRANTLTLTDGRGAGILEIL